MTGIRIEVEGIPEVVGALDSLSKAIEDMPGKETVARQGEDILQSLVPILTGELQKSIQGEVDSESALVTTTVPYAHVVNKKYHYIEALQDRIETDAVIIVDNAIQDAINQRGLS